MKIDADWIRRGFDLRFTVHTCWFISRPIYPRNKTTGDSLYGPNAESLCTQEWQRACRSTSVPCEGPLLATYIQQQKGILFHAKTEKRLP